MKMSSFEYLVREGSRSILKNRLMSVASIGVLTACLMLIGAATLFSVNVDRMVAYMETQNELVAFIKDDAPEGATEAVEQVIKDDPNVAEYHFVSKQDALEEQKDTFGDNEYLLERFEEDNIFPASFRVKMADLSQLSSIVSAIEAVDGVEKVNAPTDVANTLVQVDKLVKIFGSILVSVLVVVSLVVISNTIRLTVFSRRKEINIMKFGGATNGFIRLPFLGEGTAIGLISAALAFGLVSGAYLGVLEAVSRSGTGLLSNLYFTLLSYRSVWAPLLIGFVGSGAVLGGFGSAASVRKHLKV